MLVAYGTVGKRGERLCCESQKHRSRAMAANDPAPTASAMELEEMLARSICARTEGRVRSLQVELAGERVVLRGWAGSYHAVQLALAGLHEAFHAMGLDRPEHVELDIDVLPSAPVSSSAADSMPARYGDTLEHLP